MSVAVDRVARKYLNVVAGNAIDVDIPCFSEDHVVVLYGRVGNVALLDTDYTVALDVVGGYDDFTVTPTASLITKINALIAADPDEANQIVVRRKLDMLTDITPETAYFRKTLATEFDKTAMRFQQLVEVDSRSIRVSETDTGATSLVLPDTPARGNAGAGSCMEFDADGNVVLGPRTSTVLSQVEAARDAAIVAQTAAELAENNAETAETNAETAQAASEAARDTSQLWATKTTGAVAGGEFSAKAHASSMDANEPGTGSAKSWASRVGAAVIAGAYSAKEWAIGTFTRGAAGGGSAKDWATLQAVTVDDAEYSAKEYANGATAPTGSAKDWANKTGGAVAGGEYSAKKYAQDAAASAAALNLPAITAADKDKSLVVSAAGTWTLGAGSSPGANLYLQTNMI